MKHKLTVFFLVGVMMAGTVDAQQQKGPYTLKEVLQIALDANNSIIKAKYDFEEGAAKTRQVKSAALPQINVNADLSDNVIRQAFVFPMAISDPSAGPDDYIVLRAGMQYGLSTTVQATQQLFNKSVLTGIKAA